MKLSVAVTIALAALAPPLMAQSKSQLKRELKKLERSAKKDPDELLAAANWAREHDLEKEATQILQKILKLDPDHVGANEALGNELVDGKWIDKADAEARREKELEAKYAAQGFEKVDGIWVEAEHVDDAKKGIYHDGGETVTHDEKKALQGGWVRHPRLGILIRERYLEKAKEGYFPLGDGKWGDLKEADQFHADIETPWILRSHYATIISTINLEKLEELATEVSRGFEIVQPVLGHAVIPPAKRPVILIARTQSEYQNYGSALGDGTDVAGAFLIRDEARFKIQFQGEVRGAVCENHKEWGTRYLHHAAAISYVNALAETSGSDLPLWFVHGVGSLASRFEKDSDAGWFGKQHVAKGGVHNLKSFFKGYDLNGNQSATDVAYNIFQAGLVLSYAMKGGNQEATNALLEVTNALSGKGGNASKAVSDLEKLLINCKDGIVEHLTALIAKSP